ncbi:MAG: hypothetical protein AB7S26_42940 [Sandaracinaceae bacterium]
MIEVTILIPLASNEGDTFSPAHHATFEALLIESFGGFTRLPGNASGGWVDGGITYRDSNMVYMVLVPGLIGKCFQLTRVIAFAKRHYRQLAVTVRYLGVAEII